MESEESSNISMELQEISADSSSETTEVALPQFISSPVDFLSNHKCKRLNRIQCDNSQNYISQCSRSIHSNCNMNDLILDCRWSNSQKGFLRHIGSKYSELSQFGADSKCIKIKGRRRRKSAICSKIQCHITNKFYIIYFPETFCKKYN